LRALHTVEIERLNARGDGIAHLDGRRITVPGTLPGERVRTSSALDSRGRTVWGLEDVEVASPNRVDPACAQFDRCAGCPLRHTGEGVEADFAAERATYAVRRRLNLEVPVTASHRPVPRAGFRARLSAGLYPAHDGALVPGMRGRAETEPVDLRHCPAQSEASRAALETLMLDLESAGLADAVARISVATGDDARVRIVLGASSTEAAARLLGSALAERSGRAVAVTTRLNGPGFEAEAVALHGDLRLPFTVDGDRFDASLTSWSPQTPGSLACVQSVVARLLACEPASRVLELGCGVGTLSVHLARASASLVGVDLVRGAVDDAARNAAALGVGNATFRQGRADQAVRRLLARGDRFDRLVLHGMRRPFGLDLMNVLPALRVARVVYVAPSAISMVRDLEVLRGYGLAHLEQIAQLPGTAHTLTVGLLLP